MPVSAVFADKGIYCRMLEFLPNLPKKARSADLISNAFSCFIVGDEWGEGWGGVGRGEGLSG